MSTALEHAAGGMELGYARVPTRGQKTDAQVEELRAAGCARIFVDHGYSSRIEDRPDWLRLLDFARPGDRINFTRLDRIAGSEVMAIETLRDLARRRLNFRSLNEPALNVDTSTPMGEAIVGIMAVFAQLRVATIRDNTRRGLEYARSQGRIGGRPSVMTDERTETAVRMRQDGIAYAKIARVLGVGKSTVQRAVEKHEAEHGSITELVEAD
ncbi:MAG TPA: recombinase family protein [Gryllotalpicola sp.]